MESTNLRMLIELAIASRDGAAAQLAQARAHLTQAQTQLSALQNYAREYSGRAQQQAHSGIDVATQANWRAFDSKLAAAIAQQGREIEHRRALVLAAQNELSDMQRRLKSLETLATRQIELARQKTTRREQKHTDELAARSASAPTLTRPTDSTAPVLNW